jgi:hypothetical protein
MRPRPGRDSIDASVHDIEGHAGSRRVGTAIVWGLRGIASVIRWNDSIATPSTSHVSLVSVRYKP